jgi:hypothetical protein
MLQAATKSFNRLTVINDRDFKPVAYSIARPFMHHFTRRSRGGGERGEMHPID